MNGDQALASDSSDGCDAPEGQYSPVMSAAGSLERSVLGLLSVFHGQPFLRAQLDSLAEQQDADLSLLYALDDGDEEAGDLIEAVIPTAHRLDIGPGSGIPDVYMHLLYAAPADHAYYCFVDQDDIWMPNKLASAMDALSGLADQPALWICQASTFGTRDGHRRDQCTPEAGRWPTWSNALVENIAPGCVMLWNRSLQQLLTSVPQPRGIVMHDWWLYAVASTVGVVHFSPEPLVLYRIHAHNAVGMNTSFRARLARWLRSRSNDGASLESQAQALLVAFGPQMTRHQRAVVTDMAGSNTAAKVVRVLRGDVRRNRRRETVLLLLRLIVPRRRVNIVASVTKGPAGANAL